MNFDESISDDIKDHLNRCRFCLKSFSNGEIFMELDEIIQKHFFDLTKIELSNSSDFSSVICENCHQNFLFFSTFRSELIEKQSKLINYIKFLKQNPQIDQIIQTKIEVEDENEVIKNSSEYPAIQSQQKIFKYPQNFSCDLCKFSSNFKNDLKSHMKVHRTKSKKNESYFCESCGEKFDKRFHLNSHVRSRHTEKVRNHKCPICSKAFFSSENLKKHVDSHNEKIMPCEFCGKLFSCINNLRTHLYYHSEPKFICDIDGCGKKFFMRKRLKVHIKKHTNQKDFVCGYCEKSYFSQNDLNRHITSIHQKLRFFCEEPGCNGNFSRREYYRKHALTHHQDIGAEKMEILLHKIRHVAPCQNN